MVPVTESLVGCCRESLRRILPHLKPKEALGHSREEWLQRIWEWKQQHPFHFDETERDGIIKPQAVVQELDRQTQHIKDNVIITTGVGQHQMWYDSIAIP